MNFIQGWRARDLNNKWEIATSLSSLFYSILFYVHFLLPVIYLEILNARIRWWTGSLLTAFRMASQHADYYDFKKNSDFPPQVSDTLIGIGYLCLLSKHKLRWDCTTYGKQNNKQCVKFEQPNTKKQRLRLRIILEKLASWRSVFDGILLSIFMTCEEYLDVNTATEMEIKTPRRRQLNNLQSPVLRPEKSFCHFYSKVEKYLLQLTIFV